MSFRTRRSRPSTWLVVSGAAVVMALVGMVALWGGAANVTRVYTRWIPPKPPPATDVLVAEERQAIRELGSERHGRLLWSSNREGNHELYVAELETGELQRLTNNPHVDFFSRFSPDGRYISFLRSRRPWVSFREEDAWDLYVMQANGAGERRLVEHAYHPTWLPDGTGLLFVKNNQIAQVDLASGAERVLHDGSSPPTQGTVQEPEVSESDLIAITLRHVPRETVGVLDLERRAYTAVSSVRACQITWVPGRREVLWIESGGQGGTRVMHADLTQPEPEPEVFIDLPGSHSHEYFPRLTADREWLIWGAAAEGHEHDRADYEIFVWKRGTPASTARRITYSAGNDQWPDLFLTP